MKTAWSSHSFTVMRSISLQPFAYWCEIAPRSFSLWPYLAVTISNAATWPSRLPDHHVDKGKGFGRTLGVRTSQNMVDL